MQTPEAQKEEEDTKAFGMGRKRRVQLGGTFALQEIWAQGGSWDCGGILGHVLGLKPARTSCLGSRDQRAPLHQMRLAVLRGHCVEPSGTSSSSNWPGKGLYLPWGAVPVG